jgi:hypothetical protein
MRTTRDERRRVLAMLADAGPRGEPHALLLARGATREALSATIRHGHAIEVKTVVCDRGKTVAVSHLKVTRAGRQALFVPEERHRHDLPSEARTGDVDPASSAVVKVAARSRTRAELRSQLGVLAMTAPQRPTKLWKR